jgi:protein-tyrosine phosphatase
VIDLHVHLLPAIDDGPATAEEALELAAAAAADGTTTLAATPHVRADHPRVRPDELRGRVAELQAAMRAAGIGVAVVCGGEVDLGWALRADDDSLRQVSYGQRGRDLLVETPYGELPPSFEELLFRIRARGYRVTLAHPERNLSFQRSPHRLAQLVEQGTLVQVTAGTVAATDRGSRSRRLAHALLRDGLAHVIASDAHGERVRPAKLSEGVAAAARLLDRPVEPMVTDVPAAILAGDPIPPLPPRRRHPRLIRRRG